MFRGTGGCLSQSGPGYTISKLNGTPAATSFRLISRFSTGAPSMFHAELGSQMELTSSTCNGMPVASLLFKSFRPEAFQWTIGVPNIFRKCLSTIADPAPQDSSDTVSDIAPRIKFKRPDKTAGHIMQIIDKEAVQEVRAKREIPDIRPGYIIQLKVEVPENKRRVSTIKGIVIARRNAGLHSTFRLRRQVTGVGIESLFPLYSPNIKEIKVLDKKKVRRAKLYYLRERQNALKGLKRRE